MITKTDITNKFNEIFDSTKSYDKLSDIEKLYALLALNSSSGSGTSLGSSVTDTVIIRDKVNSANGLAIDSNGQLGINNLTNLAKTIDINALSTKLDSLLTELDNKANLTDTQPVSLSNIPLATNAATNTLQTTGNTSLASIDTKLTSGINSIVTNLVPTVGISGSKNITTAATFEVLTTSNTLASGIYVQAKTTNTGLVTVRSLGTTDGVVIEKGQSLFFAINNSNKLEVTVSVNGEGLRWWGS